MQKILPRNEIINHLSVASFIFFRKFEMLLVIYFYPYNLVLLYRLYAFLGFFF